jgi:three-Cys-motif partner protein
MSPRKPRLFDLDGLGPRQKSGGSARRHLQLAERPSNQARLNSDGAGLVPGRSDGLPVRVVKPHSAKKAAMVGADLGTVGRAMAKKWFEVHYLELFCGPGYLLDEANDCEVAGSPIQALTIQAPFDRYVLADYSADCTDALKRRIVAMRHAGQPLPATHVLQGDANDPQHLDRVCQLLDRRALILAYLDPAKPNLHWATIEYLARRFEFIDFIINLPFSAIHRSLTAGGADAPS